MSKHIRLTRLPNFDHVVDLKGYFVFFDGLKSIENDLSLSLLTKYRCMAKCDVCYIKDLWASDHYERSMDLGSDKLHDFLSYFGTICVQDDLFYLRRSHPHLYEIYRNLAPILSSGSMTNMAFVQQYPLLMKDLHFKDVYDISFTEEFLSKQNWALSRWVSARLLNLHARSKIRKVKLIVSNTVPARESMKFLSALEREGITPDIHDNLLLGRNLRHGSLTTTTGRFDHAGSTYPLLTEACLLQQSKLYSTLPNATTGQHPFHDLSESKFDPHLFIRDLLKSKKNTYGRYAGALRKQGIENKYVDYFEHVSNNLLVNDDFNFIPSLLLDPSSKFYSRLIVDGWRDTPAGLLTPLGSRDTNTLRSPFTLPRSKQKISYFKVKAERYTK